MLKKLIAILLIAITAAVFCAEKYAILIAGNFDDSSVPTDKRWNDGLGDNTEFWNDLYLQWEMLYRKGYAKENITVIFANELDMWQEEDYKYIDRRYRAANATQVELETITNYSATKGNLTTAVEALSLKVGLDDFLYVWTMSHGGSPTQSSLYFNDGEMTDTEFAGLFNTVTANKKVFVINANHAGGFLTALQAENSFVQVSSTDTKSFRADDKIKDGTYIPFLENEQINGHVYYHGEIGFHNYCASYGLTPPGLDNYNGVPLSSAATDGDMLISFLESSNWAVNYESSVENPSNGSTSWLIGHSSSFQYPTILRDAWNQGKPISEFGLRGICAVTDEVILEEDNFFNWLHLTFEENSKTTVFENKGLHVGRASSLTLESNSTITGMGNSYITTGGWSPILRFNDCSFNNIDISFADYLYTYGTVNFNSAQFLSHGYLLSESETTKLNFTNNSFFEFSGGNFKKEIDGEIYKSVEYDPTLEEEAKSMGYFDITVDNSNVLLKNVNIAQEPFYWAKEIINNSTVTIENDVIGYVALDFFSNSKFIISPNSRYAGGGVQLHESTEMIIAENGVYVGYFAGTLSLSNDVSIKLHNNAELKHNLELTNDCEMELQQDSHFAMEPGYSMNFKSGSILRLLDGSEFIVPENSALNFDPGSQLILEGNARIIIQGGGSLASYEASFSGTDGWNGIEAQVGSSVRLTYTSVKNAQIGLSAIGANINVNGSSFVDCYNGISLTNCPDYSLNNNYFRGLNSGYDSGISLTECGGSITGNTVTEFGRGVILTLSSVNLIKNKINNNRLSGVYVTGYNIPQMKNPSGKIELNNEIKNNGDVQVLLIYHANVYLADGYNNIYSDPINSIPSVPCIYTAGWQIGSSDQLDNKAVLPNIVGINAQSNYWGYSGKISDNFDSFFGVGINSLHQGYTLSYEPYAIDPYTAEPGINPRLSSNEPPSVESNHLSTALMLEDKGNIKPAIKKYEQILSKYPNSPEAYVANARLPELYLQAERDVNELLMAYDEALESEVTTDKKFFKQMKITANTKSAKYEDAISIAEEMKAEAENEAEVTLADLSIAIAEAMKKTSKSNDLAGTDTISDLLAKLTGKSGDEPTGEPSEITESVLPSQHELFQNYPNPFNPVTSIKFALAKAADVKLSVYNISGQLVSQLANGTMNAGVHAVDFDGSKLNSGIYYYTLEVDGTAMTQKMILMK